MKKPFVALAIVAIFGILSSCSGGGSTVTSGQPGAQAAPVSLTLRDTPPAGVTVVSFEVLVTGAVLQGSNGTADFSLMNSPVEVEIEKLQTEAALLNNANVPGGTYSGIKVTFSNPELTFLNGSANPIAGCMPGKVCEVPLTLNPAAVTFSAAPFPLTITAGSPIGLQMDFDLNSSIQADLSVNPTLQFAVVAPAPGTEEIEDAEELVGKVLSVSTTNNQFTLQGDLSGQSFTITVDSNTEFEDFVGCAAAPNNFSCLATGQIVEVDLGLMAAGTLLAKQVEFHENANVDDIEGTIVSVDNTTQFHMVVLDDESSISGVQAGSLVTVTIQPGAMFCIGKEDLTVPPDVSFMTSADLLVGQNVQVHSLSGSLAPSIVTDLVCLRMTQFTATVQQVNAPNFTVGGLSSLFTGATPPITSIQVRTSSVTEFEGVNVAGVSALNAADLVSLRGLLFSSASGTPGTPVLVAEKVRKR